MRRSKVTDPKALKGHNEPLKEPIEEPLEEKIISILSKAPDSTYYSLAGELGISRSTVKRSIKILIESGRIERVGGKRYGHWEIHE